MDSRELRSNVVKKLYEMGVIIDSKKLPVGDFLLSKDVCIEKKTTGDFLQSLTDNRLFEQAKNMVSNFEKSAIILEGTNDIYTERKIHPNAIRGAICSLTIDYKIPIIESSGEDETAIFLYMIAEREQIGKNKLVRLRGERKPLDKKEIKEYVVSSFPGVGRQTARNILNHFKTIKTFINAEDKDMKKVKNVGSKTIKRIKQILEEDYEK